MDKIRSRRWHILSIWIIVFTAVVIYYGVNVYNEPTRNCDRISRVIINILNSSETSLETPGSAGYIYYKAHPKQLKLTMKEYSKLIEEASPQKCLQP